MSRLENCENCGKPLFEEGDSESESKFCKECDEAYFGKDEELEEIIK